MAYDIDVRRAEEIIGYQFRDQNRLSEALEVATRLQEHTTGETIFSSDGNRRLAQLGHKVVELVLLDTWYGRGGGRGKYSSTRQDLTPADGYIKTKAATSWLELARETFLRMSPSSLDSTPAPFLRCDNRTKSLRQQL